MATAYGTSGVKTTLGSAGTSLTIAAFTLPGTNRNMAIGVTIRTTSSRTITPLRGSDTFSDVVSNLANSLTDGHLLVSTNEPDAASTALQLDISGAAASHWGFAFVSVQDAHQTTRTENATLNPDHVGGASDMAVSSATGDLVVDFYLGRTNSAIAASTYVAHGSQTQRQKEMTTEAALAAVVACSTVPGSASVNMGWDGPAEGTDNSHNHIAVSFPAAVLSSPPVNTVPTHSGQCLLLDTATPITSGDEPTVVEGSSAIASVTLAATAGLAMTLDATGTSITLTGNGTNTVILEDGASTAEYNEVLENISYTATTRGKKTITMTTSDGTLSDEDSWYVLAAIRGVSIAGAHAQIKAGYESLNSSGYGMVLDVGETSGAVTVYAEDDTSPTPLTDEQTITLEVNALGLVVVRTTVLPLLVKAFALVEADLIPMFYAAQRVVAVPGDQRKLMPTLAAEPLVATWKYPKDLYDVAVDWEGKQVLPPGATGLDGLSATVLNDGSPTLLAGSGTDGLVGYATIQDGAIGETYIVRHRQAFNSGRVLDKFVGLQIRNPRTQPLQTFFKYPNDIFEIILSWTGRLPRGAASLAAVTLKSYNTAEVDTSATYIAKVETVGRYSVGRVQAGTGGETMLLEFAQTFDNGRIFHEYAWLTVRVPPA